MAQILYLRRLRDFGEKISDSLLFIKSNWKNLFLLYGIFVVPFIIVAGIVGVLLASNIYTRMMGTADTLQFGDIVNVEFVVIVLCLLMSGASYQAAFYGYMKLYEEKKGQQPAISEVGQLFGKKFIKLFFYNIGVSVIIAFCIVIPSMLFAIAPILAFFIFMIAFLMLIMVFLHINCIYAIEDGGFGNGILRMFDLLRNRWWHSIAFTLIIGLIYYVFGFMVQILFSLLGIFSLNFMDPTSFQSAGSKSAITSMVLGFGLLILINQLFYLIVFSGIGINYYSLVEEKDGSAIEEQIDSIGTNNDRYGGIEEQY